MYPAGELNTLAARKALVRSRIAVHRHQCASNAATLLRPVEWIDHAVGRWRQFAPIAKLLGVPLGLLAGRMLMRRAGKWGKLFKFAPLVFRTAQMFAKSRA
jgi:hypothetical protein